MTKQEIASLDYMVIEDGEKQHWVEEITDKTTVAELRAGEFFGTQEECSAYMEKQYLVEVREWGKAIEAATGRSF
jgi:hypothetical protein